MIIRSLLDTDLYKFTTMNAIQKMFPNAVVHYSFIDRKNNIYPIGFADKVQKEVNRMADIRLKKEEEEFLREKAYYFAPAFIDLLKNYQFNPDEVSVSQQGDQLKIEIEGLWYRTVLWEVPLLAIISELYYMITAAQPREVEERAADKGRKFKVLGAKYSDFGTRRRFSWDVQDRIIRTLKNHSKEAFTGTSNVYFAMKHGLRPIGTHPHEWFMYHGAHFGYRMANFFALENWVNVYDGALGIALTDTYTSNVFFKNFSLKHAKLFDGLRWDSGDAMKFTNTAIKYYKNKGINPRTKTIVYSDSLNYEKVKQISSYTKGKINDAYGIGTWLTNDVGVKPLDIVIKMTGAKPERETQFIPTVKLSDERGKYTGEKKEIEVCKNTLGVDSGK